MSIKDIYALIKDAEEDPIFKDIGIDKNQFLKERQFHGYRDVDAVSEIYDKEEKRAVFSHSLQRGLLNQI